MTINNKRILIIDDTTDIHEDFKKILNGENPHDVEFNKTKALLFNQESSPFLPTIPVYEIDSAYQGQEGFELVKKAIASQNHYAMAFVDIRMPPGWDGIETIKQIWRVDPEIQIVICTAHSDYSWGDISSRLSVNDNFLILKKPFEPIEIIQLVAGLTDKWKMQQQLNQHIQNLEEVIHQRTIDLQNAKDAAEQANKIKSDFLMNVSHELLTPLNGILGFANILASETVTAPSQKDFANAILSSAKQLMQMINDIIYMSTFESFELSNTIKSDNIDMSSMIDSVVTMQDGLIKQKNITIKKTMDPELIGIKNDADQFKRILFHLISNAIKFTPARGSIEVRTCRLDSSKFRLEVIDSGIGISKDDLKKLFVPFQQLDSGMAKKYQGLGIGLALVRNIVESQGGQVGVAENAGPGTTFFVILPTQIEDFFKNEQYK